MKRKNILIFAGNLRFGGGVAVASSFIKELSLILKNEDKNRLVYNLIVSSSVFSNLRSMNVDFSVFGSFVVKDYFGLSAIRQGIDRVINNYDLVFVVFGPLYSIKKPKNLIVGFAQPWIIYTDSPAWAKLKIVERIKNKLKYYVQAKFFSRADVLVVELPGVKQKLLSKGFAGKVKVVPGCVDSVFRNRHAWKDCNLTKYKKESLFYIGVISKNYAHKNLEFYGKVSQALNSKGIDNVKFCLTLDSEEFSSLGLESNPMFINVGPLSLDQCPDFYDKIDMVLFPTLLECFSGVCVESLFMERPLIAFDYEFIRDICGDYPLYIDEGDYEECARVIQHASVYGTITNCPNARFKAQVYGDSKRRANDYIALIENSL
ncbi:glycosyltransferase [Vibrio parahaemolyticus]|uniref:Glycosyl transferase, group 1 family protein n=2 Tax=Vibrio parahaemolyticus TaxID=670 RepID=A0A5P4SAX6_VIBPH|nr:glycosyltransferase [Vibrio parahaemolyticus]ELY3407849.1 glycosyltransferase [Vibrio parahaemolyticus]MDZ5177697.1 glycosyltransferase [Vibrio parahaemolyticus]OQK30859.1 hypothetical protein XM70_c10210 [Vibrio parahaemolyticus]QFC18130.1 glycosyl transferase, group 1 family protein [Vibrio parahaemolyticus]QFC18151.1 glycosyl transferase, group 1 family protein [Vibrio parahaemolyticus]